MANPSKFQLFLLKSTEQDFSFNIDEQQIKKCDGLVGTRIWNVRNWLADLSIIINEIKFSDNETKFSDNDFKLATMNLNLATTNSR